VETAPTEVAMKPVRICVIALVAAALASCATPQQQTSAGPRSPNQMKQDELKQMEQQGQRNDFDKVKIN
jgi:outer membrane protein assembly factor BamE (lipoprotein component of BamABCDE complex)